MNDPLIEAFDTVMPDFEVPDGALVFGIRQGMMGPMFGVQSPGEVRPLELYPDAARGYVLALKAKGGRGKLAKQMLATIRQVEFEREELGLPMNADPSPEQQKLLQAAATGELFRAGFDTVGGEQPEEGGCLVGVIRRGEHFRVCVHNHGEPPAIMTPAEAREVADKAIATGDEALMEIGAEVQRSAAECDRLTAQQEAGGLTQH